MAAHEASSSGVVISGSDGKKRKLVTTNDKLQIVVKLI
jgi:hypothetical protein